MAESHDGLRALIARLREASRALMIAEVKAFGGVPSYAGRTGKEQTALRDAIAELLQFEEAHLTAEATRLTALEDARAEIEGRNDK